MKRLSNEELTAIRERVEEAKPDGYGVGQLALRDVPKLLVEIERLRKSLETVKSEIEYALYSKKSADVKRFYLENAIRFIEQGIGGDSE